MLSRLAGEPPAMWGPSIVGFARYRYSYDSGREGERCIAGFAVRGKDLTPLRMNHSPRGLPLNPGLKLSPL